MKKTLIAWTVCLAGILPVRAQHTYDELGERAMAAIGQDSLQQAERYIREALELEPDNPHNVLLFSNLGTIQRRMKHYGQALESYTFALNFAPHAVPILLDRAALYLELGRNDEARVDYSLVLDFDKDNQEALLMRAYIYMQSRDYKLGREDYRHLLKLAPDDFNGRLGLATLEQKAGNPEEALVLLDGMLADCKDPQPGNGSSRCAILYVARAGVEKDLQHADLALLDLEEALRLDASQTEAYLIRGQIYLAQGKKVPARRDFEQAIALGIPPSDLHELLLQCK